MVKVQEAEGGLVTDIAVVDESDHALLVPSVERHADVFGRVPYVVATDRGFFKAINVRRIEEMGVRRAAVPKPGYRSPSWLARERHRSFRRARAWRAGGEARIARLKNTFGMRRTRYKGASGVSRAAHWAAIANNLMAIGAAALK
jgi:transposase, IS5 family